MSEQRIYYRKVIDLKLDVERRTLIMNPDFQRKFVWDAVKQSRLIESILLDLPLNPLHFSENEKYICEIIDGQQRMTTFYRYISNQFPLRGLKKLPQFNGKKFEQLPEAEGMQILHYEIGIFKYPIRADSRQKFDIFERLNTGSSTLTAQELRNAVYHGKTNTMINHLAVHPMTDKTVSLDSRRMKDREMVLGFFVIQNNTELALRRWGNYSKELMDNFMAENINMPDVEIELCKEKYLAFLQVIKDIYGELPLFRIPKSGRTLRWFNEGTYWAVCYVFPQYDYDILREHAEEIEKATIELVKSQEFELCQDLSSRIRYKYKAELLKQCIDKCIGE